jgi:mycothiol synthase
MSLPQLEMIRASLEGLPAQAAPAGYIIRPYRPGDATAWCELVREGIGGEPTDDGLAAAMAQAVDFDPDDLLFAVNEGKTVGTAWALREAKSPPDTDTGTVHMVSVAPQHRGRGLGRALVLAVLHRFRQLGLRRAVLLTDDHRLAAIGTYLGLGFRPRLTHESHEERWRGVSARLDPDYKEVVSEALSDG